MPQLKTHAAVSSIAGARSRSVAAGEIYLDPLLAGKVVTYYVDKAEQEITPGDVPLSQRETEVLKLIAWGYTNKEIGAQLRIRESTAKFHVRAILRKCGAKNRVDIVREYKIAPALELVSNQRVLRAESPRISLGSPKLGSDQTRRPVDGRPSRTGSARGTAAPVVQ